MSERFRHALTDGRDHTSAGGAFPARPGDRCGGPLSRWRVRPDVPFEYTGVSPIGSVDRDGVERSGAGGALPFARPVAGTPANLSTCTSSPFTAFRVRTFSLRDPHDGRTPTGLYAAPSHALRIPSRLLSGGPL